MHRRASEGSIPVRGVADFLPFCQIYLTIYHVSFVHTGNPNATTVLLSSRVQSTLDSNKVSLIIPILSSQLIKLLGVLYFQNLISIQMTDVTKCGNQCDLVEMHLPFGTRRMRTKYTENNVGVRVVACSY